MNRLLRAAGPRRRSFRSGGHTVLAVAVIYLVALPIALWIGQDALRAGPTPLGVGMGLALWAFACLVGLVALAAFQRVGVDPAGGSIDYANITTGHRQRRFAPDEVVGMALHRAKDGRMRLTSSLELRLAPAPHRAWTTATLFDGDMSGDGRGEPLATIIHLVAQARPDAVLDANLRALLAAGRYGSAGR